jgi:tRNA(adenine34) deaminase
MCMLYSIEQALLAKEKGEVPIGALLKHKSGIITKSHNLCITNNDPSAHAEMNVIRKAGQYLNNYRLDECELYVTVEPCIMCVGAILHARIHAIHFATFSDRWGSSSSLIDYNKKIKIYSGQYKEYAKRIIQTFFQEKRISSFSYISRFKNKSFICSSEGSTGD